MRELGEDTIAAISTPPGEGGIAIVRLSGPQALQIAERMFRGKRVKSLENVPTHTIHYGHIVEDGKIYDEVLLTVMRAPRTYTREDIVEINCHGGIAVARTILDYALRCGARLAQPGEFTRRALVNGRIDLTQAEAVLAIVRAKTSLACQVAARQIAGDLSCQIKELRGHLIEVLAHIEAGLDFPEEELEIWQEADIITRLKELVGKTERLLESGERGRVLGEGVRVAIVGKPNVGKSSLLNRLLRQERAIVTQIPGTTRDTIEEVANICGIPVRLIDTAGLRVVEDVIEQAGVERTKAAIESADLVVIVFDRSGKLEEEDLEVIEAVEGKTRIALLNKCDLPQKLDVAKLREVLKGDLIEVSAKTGEGIDVLEERIAQAIWGGEVRADEEIFIMDIRGIEALREAKGGLEEALEALEEGLSGEFVALGLQRAAEALSRITGETVGDDVLDMIFERFCIGK